MATWRVKFMAAPLLAQYEAGCKFRVSKYVKKVFEIPRGHLRSRGTPTCPPAEAILTIQPLVPDSSGFCFIIWAMACFIPRKVPRALTACTRLKKISLIQFRNNGSRCGDYLQWSCQNPPQSRPQYFSVP